MRRLRIPLPPDPKASTLRDEAALREALAQAIKFRDEAETPTNRNYWDGYANGIRWALGEE